MNNTTVLFVHSLFFTYFTLLIWGMVIYTNIRLKCGVFVLWSAMRTATRKYLIWQEEKLASNIWLSTLLELQLFCFPANSRIGRTEWKPRRFSPERWLVHGICTENAEDKKIESWGSKIQKNSRYFDLYYRHIWIKVDIFDTWITWCKNP